MAWSVEIEMDKTRLRDQRATATAVWDLGGRDEFTTVGRIRIGKPSVARFMAMATAKRDEFLSGDGEAISDVARIRAESDMTLAMNAGA